MKQILFLSLILGLVSCVSATKEKFNRDPQQVGGDVAKEASLVIKFKELELNFLDDQKNKKKEKISAFVRSVRQKLNTVSPIEKVEEQPFRGKDGERYDAVVVLVDGRVCGESQYDGLVNYKCISRELTRSEFYIALNDATHELYIRNK